ILQQRQLLSSDYLRSFQGFSFKKRFNFNHLRCRSLISGRRILQRYTLLSTPLLQRFRASRN
ncbi:hypothetical protein, partial [Pseudomonas agarici]|uniref:hypothetical protein n=1 Tax=Pseudomonas agarici TaxID=46677 RepID=UPI001C4330EF